MFFRNAYGVPQNPDNPRSIVDSILGDIGEPLRVEDDGDDNHVKADGEDIVELRPILKENAVSEELQGNSTKV